MQAFDGWPILVLGLMILGGFLAHLSGPFIHVPRVTLLLLIGALLSPAVLGIVPQAGVALGFALLVEQRLPGYGSTVLTLVIATTVVFEITGPLLARWQLHAAEEWGAGREEAAT